MTSYVSELKVPPLLSRHAGEVRPEHPHEGKQLVFAPPEHQAVMRIKMAFAHTHCLGPSSRVFRQAAEGIPHKQREHCWKSELADTVFRPR